MTKRTNLWIETDLEPDDVLCIDILLRKKYNVHTIVCGEGDIDRKIFRCVEYYKNHVSNFIKGYGSDKDFPETSTTGTIEWSTNYEMRLNEYLVNNNRMVIIKPPRELLNMYLNDKENTVKLMKNVTCFMYGSFNLRCLSTEFERHSAISGGNNGCSESDNNVLLNFLRSFGTLYLYESYNASGTENTINNVNYKNFEKLEQCEHFFDIMNQWNNYIVKDCVDTCNLITGKSEIELLPLEDYDNSEELMTRLSENEINRYYRNYKCYESIMKFDSQQFVVADVGLALCVDLDVWTPVNMSFNDAGYTMFNETSPKSTNMYTVSNIGISRLIELLDSIY